MGGNDASGFQPGLPPVSGGGSGLPWWVYLIIILIGVAVSIFCFVQYAAARRRAGLAPALAGPPPLPGAPPPPPAAPPPGTGNGFLVAGIGAALLLVLAPLVVMLIMKPWGSDSWIVGRWSERPGCMGDTVEFTSGGTLIAEGRSGPYRLEGDQLTFNGQTQTVRREGDRIIARSETLYRCSGSDSSASTGTGTSGPLAPPSAPTGSAYDTPQRAHVPSQMTPSYASWLVGRWSDSDCSRSMEFRADGTATTANGQPATYTVTPNGAGVGIVIEGGGQRIAGYMDQDGGSGAVLRAYAPSQQTVNLRRCY